MEKTLNFKRSLKKTNVEHQENKKKIPNAFVQDGLDYILEVINKKHSLSQDSEYLSDEDIEEDFSSSKQLKELNYEKLNKKNRFDVLGQKEDIVEGSDHMDKSKLGHNYFVNFGQSMDFDTSKNKVIPESISFENDNELTSNITGLQLPNSSNPVKPKLFEDIYGRLRDTAGNVLKNENFTTEAYVLPAKRFALEDVDGNKKSKLIRIRRQLKGLLNRLSESNMQAVCTKIEEMYMKSSRNDMNETLMSLMTELVLSPVMTPPRLIMEQAMLVAFLHSNVGSEVGAYFLQCLAAKLHHLFKSGGNYGQEKECNNVVIFISHLYNCKVMNCKMIFDVLHCLVESFQTKDIELLQLLLKNVGLCLRKDDPLKLKEVIHSIKTKAQNFNFAENSSRVQFMLETLTAIRNNNMYKIPEYDPSIAEHMIKVVRGLQQKGGPGQVLVVSFEDLLKAEQRGHLWNIGSPWSEPFPNRKRGRSPTNDALLPEENLISDKILKLAKKQHMNTEIRKAIFCIIMTAEDYIDCFEKLMQLNLKDQQEREIINVILHCSLQEKNYNPYYAYLAGKFCNFARKFHITLQFSLWDKFKELDQLKYYQIKCLAQFLTHLFTTGALPISVLKVLHFSEMSKIMVQFFRQILLEILLHNSENVCCQVFKRIAQASNLKLLREGICLFMHHFLLKNISTFETNVADKLTERIKLAERALNSSKSGIKL